MLRDLGTSDGTDRIFGVKVNAVEKSGGLFWRRPTWHYGPTALIALDTALAYLVSEALYE